MTAGPLSPQPRTVLLVLDRSRAWRWSTWLAKALDDDGNTVAFQFVETRQPLPSAVHLLMQIERLLFAMPPDQASALLDGARIKGLPRAGENARYDVAIDLTDTQRPSMPILSCGRFSMAAPAMRAPLKRCWSTAVPVLV